MTGKYFAIQSNGGVVNWRMPLTVPRQRLAELLKAAKRARVLVVGDAMLEDYNKGVLVPAVIEPAIAKARAKERPVVVDPKYKHFFAYRGATVFKPNRRELDSALGAEVDVDHPEAIPTVIQRLDVDHLLL